MFRRYQRALPVLLILPAFAASSSGLIQVTNIRSWTHPDNTRVIIDTTGPFEFHSERAFNPDRLFFDVQHARPLMSGHRYGTRVVNDSLVRRVRVAETLPGTTRIVFDLTGPVTYRAFKLDTPDRLVIEVRASREATSIITSGRTPFVYPTLQRPLKRVVNLAGSPPLLDPAPMARILLPDLDMLIALAPPPRASRAVLRPSAPSLQPAASLPLSATTVVLMSPRPIAYDARSRPSENATHSLTRALGLKVNRIVIDAGHGGHDEGTVGTNGLLEKDVVLDVALRLAKLVQIRMSAEVVLTRSDDTFIPLHERTAIANDRKADLFLSIHANSSPSPAVAGTETFYLNLTNSPSALDVASRENAGADKSVGELHDLIQSITLNDKIAESETFAQTLETQLFGQAAKSNVAARNRGVKRAPFVVLIGASMPSILAEIGFLSNAKDEANLAKPDYRQKVAEALYKGLAQYSQSLSHFEVAVESARKSDKPPPRARIDSAVIIGCNNRTDTIQHARKAQLPRKSIARKRTVPAAAAPAANGHSPAESSLDDPALYVNRELSLLEFQKRVLEEARDSRNKLLERVKFLSIVCSNLDEFFMVRLAALKQKLSAGNQDLSIDGRTVSEQLSAVRENLAELMKEIYECFQKQLLPALRRHGIYIADYEDLDTEERAVVDRYYAATVFPVLTPLAYDPGRPFPHISNLSLNLAIVLQDIGGRNHFGRVKVPEQLPQLVEVPQTAEKKDTQRVKFVWIEQVIAANLQPLFPGWEIVESHPFHVTRDAEVAIKELESDDLLESVEEAVWRRRFRKPVRLQADIGMSDKILQLLIENLEVDTVDVAKVQGPLDLTRLRQLPGLDRPHLRDEPLEPWMPPFFSSQADEDFFGVLRRGDHLLHHPFQSFVPVLDLLKKAAHDPEVLAIKMTLYRVGPKSPIVKALLDAIENGKQVAVLVELKARFDEESNIEWARALEREGVHVVYGLLGLKVHCKIALIVRRELDGIRRYVHLGTGNYNPSTGRLYTDLSLFTADPEIGADATDLFNYLTGYSYKSDFRRLMVAPVTLRKSFETLIRREIALGAQGRLIFKMNALEDKGMIRLLYEASRAGVRVDLIVRGLCCLRPGLPGVSDNITVRSIVGRFLEHSRIYYFGNGGKEEIYAGSADLMPRNLDRRVELLFPVLSPKLVRYMRETILEKYLLDSRKMRLGKADGTYEVTGTGSMDSQVWFIAHRSAQPE